MRTLKIAYLVAALAIFTTVAYVLITNAGMVDLSQTPDWLGP